MKKKYILLTGATGLLGYALVHVLLKMGYTPILLVRQSSSLHKFKNIRKSIEVLVVDFEDKHSLQSAFKMIQNNAWKIRATVYALAATKGGSQKELDHTNVFLLELFSSSSKEIKFSLGKMIFISSIGIHGHTYDIQRMIHKNTPFNPTTYYAVSKVKAEKILTQNFDNYSIIRPAVIFGEYDKEAMILHQFIHKGLHFFFDSNKNQVGFIHAEDLSYQVVDAIESKECNNIMIGCSHNFSIKDYFSLLSESYRKKKILSIIFPQFILLFLASINNLSLRLLTKKSPMFSPKKVYELTCRSWAADTSDYEGSLKNLRIPKVPFQQRLQQTADWYIAHEWKI